MLAAQYVVGTLAGRARKRFESLLLNDADLRGLVGQWSDRMNTLGANLPRQSPTTDLLPIIKQRLGFQSVRKQSGVSKAWRYWALLTSLASVLLVMVLIVRVPEPVELRPYNNIVSVLVDNARTQTVLIKSSLAENTLSIKILQTRALARSKDLELWVVTTSSPKPKSLGVIPASGTVRILLTPQNITWLKNAKAFAISVEPKGGSPTGSPTGPIPYQGTIHQL